VRSKAEEMEGGWMWNADRVVVGGTVIGRIWQVGGDAWTWSEWLVEEDEAVEDRR
jgi:hypothetical protein